MFVIANAGTLQEISEIKSSKNSGKDKSTETQLTIDGLFVEENWQCSRMLYNYLVPRSCLAPGCNSSHAFTVAVVQSRNGTNSKFEIFLSVRSTQAKPYNNNCK